MKTVKFLKDFQQHKKGDILTDVSPERAKYWIGMKVAAETSAKAVKPIVNEEKPKAKTRKPKK